MQIWALGKRFRLRFVGATAVLLAVATALCAVPLAAGAGKAERAGRSTIDRTVSCSTELGALRIFAFPTDPAAGAASASVSTGNPAANDFFVGVDTRYTNYTQPSKLCRAVSANVGFAHVGLTSGGGISAGSYGGGTVYCAVPRHVVVRFRLAFDSSAKPAAATFVIWTQPQAHSGKKTPLRRAIAFVQWSPQHSITYYASSACTTH